VYRARRSSRLGLLATAGYGSSAPVLNKGDDQRIEPRRPGLRLLNIPYQSLPCPLRKHFPCRYWLLACRGFSSSISFRSCAKKTQVHSSYPSLPSSSPRYRPRRRPSSSISERATLTSPAKPPRRLPSLPTFDPNCHWSLCMVVVLPSPSLNAKSLVPPA
jgi:hypothetical protein